VPGLVVGGRLKLTAPVVPEDDLHLGVVRALEVFVLPPAIWWCYPAGHILLNGQQAVKLYRMGLRRGLPDFMVLHAGRLLGLELKRPGGRLSRSRMVRRKRNGALVLVEGQAEVFPRLAAAGMVGPRLCASVDEVLAELRAFGVPLRRTS
jgi:hypothetical protein